MAAQPDIKIEKQGEKYLLIIQTPETQITHPFVPIPAGSFLRKDGSTVSVNAFYMAQFTVTQEVYEAIVGINPSYYKGKQNPVVNIDWYDSIEFCRILNKILKISDPFYTIYNTKNDTQKDNDEIFRWKIDFNNKGKGFRLPTEAEWEYTNRTNSKTIFAGSNILEHVGWFQQNSVQYETRPIGLKFPNKFGIYDMSGNVWEWCWDLYEDYRRSNLDNPTGGEKGEFRVFRGGSNNDDFVFCKIAFRECRSPDGRYENLGCRIVYVP